MSSPFDLLIRPAREPIRRWVLSAFPRADTGSLDYDHPHGDPGLFGPHTATWRVHADFPGMLAGGLAALTLQTLHPLALRPEEHTSELQSLMRISYAVLCLNNIKHNTT